MKSQIELLHLILKDLGYRCSTSTTGDWNTVSRRFEYEGWSFVTITLPGYGRDFERCLDRGLVTPSSFSGFATKRGGPLPRFLGGFLGLIFDPKTGRLLPGSESQKQAIFAVRQITLLYGKINLPCAEFRERAAIRNYMECEKNVLQFDNEVKSHPELLDDYTRIGRLLWGRLFSRIDNTIFAEGLLPKHGPGATADMLRGNAKFIQSEWPARMEAIPGLSHWENLISSESFLDRLVAVNILEPGAERPVRVITVPKTLKTPRIIAIEPAAMQYMQQGVLEVMMRQVENDDFARHFVKFDRDGQQINQLLAQEGSRDGSLATLDLSEASDRVSMQHVSGLLERHTISREVVFATRSQKAAVPGNGVIPLAKFASMGSALCFPFEALVFTTVVFLGIERVLNRPLTRKDIKFFFGKVRVYGDDIIVPTHYVHSVMTALEAFGFRVNHHKSFWTGKFRESCGKEYYDGHDVSISRVRTVLPSSRRHASELISTVSLRNQLAKAGFVGPVLFLDAEVEKLIPFPYVAETSALLGRHTCVVPDNGYVYPGVKLSDGTIVGLPKQLADVHDTVWPSQSYRYDTDLHRPLVKGVLVDSQLPKSNLDDYGALMKWFLKRGDKPFERKDHLEYAGRPRAVRIKTRWASPV